MVKHVLFVKLKNNSPESCRELKDLFLSMKGRVEAIGTSRWGGLSSQ